MKKILKSDIGFNAGFCNVSDGWYIDEEGNKFLIINKELIKKITNKNKNFKI